MVRTDTKQAELELLIALIKYKVVVHNDSLRKACEDTLRDLDQ